MITSYKIIVQKHNQDIDIDIYDLPALFRFPWFNLYSFVCMCLCVCFFFNF